MLATQISHFLRVTVVATALAIAGCQTAPVQEMSDARMAISVAQKAGAEQYSPSEIDLAVRHLQNAERFLNDRNYKQARVDAVSAKDSALQALHNTEASIATTP